MAIFCSKWRLSTILDLLCACLDHPRQVFGGIYHCAIFGWNHCRSFNYMQVLIFKECGLKMSIAPNGVFLEGILPQMQSTHFCTAHPFTQSSNPMLCNGPDTQPFMALFWDHPGEPVPEENFWTLSCKGRLTEADTLTIWLGATPSGLTSAYLLLLPISFCLIASYKDHAYAR